MRSEYLKSILRSTAYVALCGVFGIAAYKAFEYFTTERVDFQDLEARAYVSRARFIRLTGDFDAHFRVNVNAPFLDTIHEVPWSRVAELFPTDSTARHGLRLDYGLKGGRLKIGWTALSFDSIDTNKWSYRLPDSLRIYDAATGWHWMTRKQWRDDYQDCPWGTFGRYLREMELRRHNSSMNFERSQRGQQGDPIAEVFAWEDELLVMWSQNLPVQGLPGSTRMLAVRCVSEPADTANLRYYQHRMCLFLRDRNGTEATDLLDDSAHTDTAQTPLLFRMRGSDFGNLCPPSCDEYTLPVRVRR